MGFIPIKHYRDFWDVPRIFIAQREGSAALLFDCKFDQTKEDYDNSYDVYLMSEIPESDLEGSWEDLPKRSQRFLGKVSIDDVKFDVSRRSFIDDENIKILLDS